MNRAERTPQIIAIEAILTERIGLDPASVSPSLVVRASKARMAALGISDLSSYEQRLLRSSAEQQELIEEVVIPESWFFRDDRPFGLLRDLARARLTSTSQRPLLRVLSLACARGEEPLSIAMTFRDVGLKPGQYRIGGVDVSARNLEQAKRGWYSMNAFRGAHLEFRDRYFQRSGVGYQAVPELLQSVHYQCANVLSPSLLVGEPPYDIIFCRNLLIYLTAEARSRVLPLLDRLLVMDGLLVLGHADRLGVTGLTSSGSNSATFVPHGDPACFAFRKADRKAAVVRVPAEPLSIPFEFPPLRAEPLPALPSPKLAEHAVPLSTHVAEPASQSLLDQATELANQGKHAEAMQRIEQHLKAKGPSATVFYLMGGIAQASDDRNRAERCFQKAVYLDPEHDEALLALALLADRRGEASAAAGYRRRAERAATAKEVS